MMKEWPLLHRALTAVGCSELEWVMAGILLKNNDLANALIFVCSLGRRRFAAGTPMQVACVAVLHEVLWGLASEGHDAELQWCVGALCEAASAQEVTL